MRLNQYEREIIKDKVKQHFGANASVFLFGSRTDDNAHGGDIDLLIETPEVTENAFQAIIGLETNLQMTLYDQKFDILLYDKHTPLSPIINIGKKRE